MKKMRTDAGHPHRVTALSAIVIHLAWFYCAARAVAVWLMPAHASAPIAISTARQAQVFFETEIAAVVIGLICLVITLAARSVSIGLAAVVLVILTSIVYLIVLSGGLPVSFVNGIGIVNGFAVWIASALDGRGKLINWRRVESGA